MHKIETWLPVFPGFYNTIFEPCKDMEIESLYEARKENGFPDDTIGFEHYKFDYTEYEQQIAKNCCKAIETELKDNKLVDSIKFESVQSPREYNFENDSINCTISISDENIKAIVNLLLENKELFAKYLKDNYTSYDGFISFFPNELDKWLEMTNIETFQENPHVLASLFEFILSNILDYGHLDLYYNSTDDLHLSLENFDELATKPYCNECNQFEYIEKGYCTYCEKQVCCGDCNKTVDNYNEDTVNTTKLCKTCYNLKYSNPKQLELIK